jgi:hypothetical protein
VPGVTGRDRDRDRDGDGRVGQDPARPPASVPVSPAVAALQQALAGLAGLAGVVGTDRSRLPDAQVLADSEALLAAEQQLRRLTLRQIGEVQARGLHQHAGYRSAKTWLRRHRPDGDSTDAALAGQLRDHPTLAAAVQAGHCSLRAGRQVLAALRRCAPHLDRPDQLIDGQPAEQVLTAVLSHALTLICQHLRGLHDTDPRLQLLLDRAQQLLHQHRRGGTQLGLLEATFSWLAQTLPPSALARPLDELVMSVLPNDLHARHDRGHD